MPAQTHAAGTSAGAELYAGLIWHQPYQQHSHLGRYLAEIHSFYLVRHLVE